MIVKGKKSTVTKRRVGRRGPTAIPGRAINDPLSRKGRTTLPFIAVLWGGGEVGGVKKTNGLRRPGRSSVKSHVYGLHTSG